MAFTLSPDAQWVVYQADQDTDERCELFAVPTDGSRAAVKLNRPADQDVALATLSYDSA